MQPMYWLERSIAGRYSAVFHAPLPDEPVIWPRRGAIVRSDASPSGTRSLARLRSCSQTHLDSPYPIPTATLASTGRSGMKVVRLMSRMLRMLDQHIGVGFHVEMDALRRTPIELRNSTVGGDGDGEANARSTSLRRPRTLGSKKLRDKLKSTGQAAEVMMSRCPFMIENEATQTIVYNMRN